MEVTGVADPHQPGRTNRFVILDVMSILQVNRPITVYEITRVCEKVKVPFAAPHVKYRSISFLAKWELKQFTPKSKLARLGISTKQENMFCEKYYY